uniref:TIR domain-containing protein n=1 Tax=Macrostomum lignano TaxID=282301 RepID=A0A1I8IB28_9PLAT
MSSSLASVANGSHRSDSAEQNGKSAHAGQSQEQQDDEERSEQQQKTEEKPIESRDGEPPGQQLRETLDQLAEHIRGLQAAEVESFNEESLKFAFNTTRMSFHNSDPTVLNQLEQVFISQAYLTLYTRLLLHCQRKPWPDVATPSIIRLSDTVWNMTHLSVRVCQELVGLDLIRQVLGALSHCDRDNLKNARARRLCNGLLSVLHNVIRALPHARASYRIPGYSVVDVLKHFLCDTLNAYLYTKVVLVLSFVVTEEENRWLNVSDEHIRLLIRDLRQTLDASESGPHFCPKLGYQCDELLQGVDNLCGCDFNKTRFVNNGLLELIEDLLVRGAPNDSELLFAVEIVYHLAFDDVCREGICQRRSLVDQLTGLANNCRLKDVRRSACGTLWKLHGHGLCATPTSSHAMPLFSLAERSPNPVAGHVMLSYQHASQDTVLLIRKRLQMEGYEVWLDIENMSQSIVSKMAEAVENSAVILMCMSQSYKNSPHCRHEADYAYKLQKPIVPLVMEPKYQPDGWLGLLMGSKMFYDFSDEDLFEESFANLLKELGGRGKAQLADSSGLGDSVRSLQPLQHSMRVSHAEASREGTPCGSEARQYAKHRSQHTASILAWTPADVTGWLAENQLAEYEPHFADVSGELLFELHHMQSHAPEAFYACMRKQLGMRLVDMLRMSRALHRLSEVT